MNGEGDQDDGSIAGDVLTYWFGAQYWAKRDPPNPTTHYDDLWRERWFAKEELTKQVDDYLRHKFGPSIERAIAGDLDAWKNTAHESLALIILLDQFTRNIYRGTAKAWSGDARALSICLHCIKTGLDKELKPVARAMLYMPLLHAEDLELQQQSVAAYEGLLKEAKQRYPGQCSILQRFVGIAQRYEKVTQLFGRFPERNKYLGRHSTVEEEAYLLG